MDILKRELAQVGAKPEASLGNNIAGLRDDQRRAGKARGWLEQDWWEGDVLRAVSADLPLRHWPIAGNRHRSAGGRSPKWRIYQYRRRRFNSQVPQSD